MTRSFGPTTTAAEEARVEVLSPDKRVTFPDEWYDLNYQEHFWFRWRQQILMKLISQLNLDIHAKARVLDIGCGTGIVRDMVEAKTSWVIDGADLSARGKSHLFLWITPDFLHAAD